MFATATQELIWHFAGYLRLPDFDYATLPTRYDGEAPAPNPADVPEAPSHTIQIFGDDDYPGARLGSFGLVDPNPIHGYARPSHVHSHLTPPHIHLPHAHEHHVLPPQLPATGIAGEIQSLQLHITATYQPGGDQELIDIRQINLMNNNNVVDNHDVNAPQSLITANSDHAAHKMAQLLDAANQADDQNVLPIGANTTTLKSFVDANDSNIATTQAHDAPFEVQPGLYVNGALHTGGADPHQVTTDALNTVSTALDNGLVGPPASPTGDYHNSSIETVSTGSNITANDATLVNLEGATISLAVQGNYYFTQEIVQTNVFQESDHITGSTASSAHVSMAANTIDNIADIQDQPPTLTSGGGGTMPSGLNWSVTVLNGSLEDIHSLVQTNYLTNNNVVSETTMTGDSQVVAGSNTLVNSAQFENLTENYNLIIVEGNYHQDDLITQTNVVLDSNTIGLSGDGTAAQSVSGGGNTLDNDATIVSSGNNSPQQMTVSAQSVVQSLENQDGTLNVAAIEKAFPDLVGNINVLVVTGDYYDVNYVSQTNIISNVNTVAMNGSQGSLSGGASQSVQTGHDLAVNAASIFDAGSATSPYLQGQYYNDLILIQSNIVTDGTKITGNDPSQLASELAAFVGTTETTVGTQPASSSSAVDFHHHHSNDVMASILH
jgi:hypothetical protein